MKTILYNETIPVYKEYKFNRVMINTLTVNKRVSKWMKLKRLLSKEIDWWMKVIGFRPFGQ